MSIFRMCSVTCRMVSFWRCYISQLSLPCINLSFLPNIRQECSSLITLVLEFINEVHQCRYCFCTRRGVCNLWTLIWSKILKFINFTSKQNHWQYSTGIFLLPPNNINNWPQQNIINDMMMFCVNFKTCVRKIGVLSLQPFPHTTIILNVWCIVKLFRWQLCISLIDWHVLSVINTLREFLVLQELS